MELEELIKYVQKTIECIKEFMKGPNKKEEYKGYYTYTVTVLKHLEELKHLRVVNKNISRELITRTDNLKKANLEAQKYFDLLMEDEKVINAMAESIELQQYANVDTTDLSGVCEELNCNKKCDLVEEKCIIKFFRKRCE